MVRHKNKFLVVIYAGENIFVDSEHDTEEEAFNHARVVRRSMLQEGYGLPVGIAKVLEVYD